MARLSVKVLIILALCIMSTWSVPAPPNRRGGRLQALEKQVKQLVQEAARLRRLRAHVRAKFTERFNRLVGDVDELKRREWALKRTQYRFPGVQKTQLASDASVKLQLPKTLLPKNTKAVFFAIKCDVWNESFSASMRLGIKQTGNEQAGETVYDAPMNDFYYETAIPWNSKFGNEMTVSVKGSSENLYSMTLTGYITG